MSESGASFQLADENKRKLKTCATSFPPEFVADQIEEEIILPGAGLG